MGRDKKTFSFTVFLLKDIVTDFSDCLRSTDFLKSSIIAKKYGINGIVYYSNSNYKKPKWKAYLDELSGCDLDISDNSSSKAVIIVKIENRFMAVVFGYGRSLIKEELIERNFGLRVCLNLIDQSKMRSINAATVEDMVVTTQKQASYSTSQEEFDLNTVNDIIRGITGIPYDEKYGKTISGKDSLVVSIPMDLSELPEKLKLYYIAYSNDRYKDIGFGWVDNVSEVKDPILKEELIFSLCQLLEKKQLDNIHVAPPETVDWEHIEGFFLGNGKKASEYKNYTFNIDIKEYINSFKSDSNILQKIKKDRLMVWSSSGQPYAICNIYSAIVCQIEFKGKTYIFNFGLWYQIDKSFFEQVNKYIKSIPISKLKLPACNLDESEGDYNERISKADSNLCLMDKKLVSVFHGPKHIEACDIFTKDKQFVCIKNRDHSAQLSHLFSQGRVAAECFVSDEDFRKQVYNSVKKKLGGAIFDYKKKPFSNEFEIIYGIIYDKSTSDLSDLNKVLPFFSKVNLMLTCQDLDRMMYKYSVCIIKKE